jgi:hypothetical protein
MCVLNSLAVPIAAFSKSSLLRLEDHRNGLAGEEPPCYSIMYTTYCTKHIKSLDNALSHDASFQLLSERSITKEPAARYSTSLNTKPVH